MPRAYSLIVPWLQASRTQLSPDLILPGTLTTSSGSTRPWSIRAENVRVFSTLPGVYASVIARLPRSFAATPEWSLLSKLGAFASVSTSPVLTLVMMTAPQSALVLRTWSAINCSACHCRPESVVSWTSCPFTAGTVALSPSGIFSPLGELS